MSVYVKIDGCTEREVLHMSYSIHQETDVEGRPTAIVRGGRITLTTKSFNDGKTDLFEWACEPHVSKNGSIEFEKRDGTNMKTLKIEDAYLVEYEENFDSVDDTSQLENWTLSAKKIDIGGAYHENKWAD